MSCASKPTVEICPKCCRSIPLQSYPLPFATNISRAHHYLPRDDAFRLEIGLSDPIAEASALSAEIQRLEILLPILQQHRAHLDYHIRQTRVYTARSPIRQLPTEILTVIFAFACTSYEPEYHKTPLSISLVCFKWRGIATVTPYLWTNIYAGPKPEARALFNHYLERCGELPISLKINKPCIANRPSLLAPRWIGGDSARMLVSARAYQDHVDGLHEIYCTFRRWVAVELHVQRTDMNFLRDHTTKDGPGLPILESLTLALKDGGAKAPNYRGLFSAFRNAPHLTRLDVNNTEEYWRNPATNKHFRTTHTSRQVGVLSGPESFIQ
ncbi:hypothetical protein CPB85DRAFT_202823 [Mucidula mucida]|nr:hypothetical protein CPB85DRAFT_202823 [Mucidula mucida]